MRDIRITRDGVAGRITLNRLPELNAMTHEMCNAIVVALDTWRSDPEITLVIFDAMGQKAFCAGGDIVELYTTGQLGNFAYGQNFWRDEYRLNAKIKGFPKPVISFMQGFIMGGGVGLGCHGSHRVVGDSSQIAMPECGIGLVPDVGGSLILANAPGRLGEYLGTTGARLNAGDAIMAGFADHYIPEEKWPVLIKALGEKGDCRLLFVAAQRPPEGPVTRDKDHIDCCFSGDALVDIINVLRSEDTPFSQSSLKAMRRNSPLSMACEIEKHSPSAGHHPDSQSTGVGVPFYLSCDGAWGLSGRYSRRDHRQRPQSAVAACSGRGAIGGSIAHVDAAGPRKINI